MRRILIFGNSGSGKSTLAKKLCDEHAWPHLDLDTLAWQATQPPIRQPLNESKESIDKFSQATSEWVIEGCYTDLLQCAEPYANEIVFMNLPVSECIANAKQRPWEPHKYDSKAAQDENLPFLIEWISQYAERTDTLSNQAHQFFYRSFKGRKTSHTSNSHQQD